MVLALTLLLGFSPSTWRVVKNWLVDFISKGLDILARHRYPIIHENTGESIPSLPYRWPDGQGDMGKFIHGIENSQAWAKEYGSVYRIWSGIKPEIVLQKSEHIKLVFRDSEKHTKAVDSNSGYLMSQILGKCLGLLNGPQWHSLRSVVEPSFRHNDTAFYFELVRTQVRSHLREHLERGCGEGGGIIDPVKDFHFLPFLILGNVIYGPMSSEMESDLRQMKPGREQLYKHMIRGGLTRYSWSKYLPTQANRYLAEFREQWIPFNVNAYQRAHRQGWMEKPIVQLFRAAEKGHISMENVHQTLDEMLFGNLDVTLGPFSWNLVFLAAHRDVQDELHASILAAETKGSRGLEQYLKDSSTYLAACISECSRLKPLAAFSNPQATSTDRIVDGFIIPAGTDFIVDAYSLHNEESFWGSDRHVYRPSRFFKLRPSETRYHLWRFGFGPRQCLGKYVADLIIRTFLVYLIRDWELGLRHEEGTDPAQWKRDMETWITHPRTELTYRRREAKATRPLHEN